LSSYICNTDRNISVIPNGSFKSGNCNYIEIEANNAKVGGKKVLLETISFTVSGCSMGNYIGSGGGGINSSSKNKIEGLKVLRKDDEGVCNGTLTYQGSTISCSCKHKIIDAGQSKAKIE